MVNTKISIIIPTFNRSSTLPYAIESVQIQDFEGWELIIIDDGSTDETGKKIEPFLRDERIRYYFQENKGVSAARNRGAELAKGEFLIFLDSDDTFAPDLFHSLRKIKFMHYDLLFWDVHRNTDGKFYVARPKKLGRLYNNIKATFLAGSVCFRKSVFFEVGGYDPLMTFGENYELGLRISHTRDLKIKYINKTLLNYFLNTKERSSNSIQNRLNSHIHQYKKHKDKYKEDRKAKAKMNYLIGYVLEKMGRKSAAKPRYKSSWINSPLNPKPLLRIIYLYLIR